MPSVREVRIRDADADSSGDYPNRADRERRVRASANREREDGGVCGTSFSGVAEALAEERRESVDSRADEGVGVANVRGDERYGKVYRFTVVRFSRRR